MTLRDAVENLNLSVSCGEDQLDREVTGGYSGDLLSDVIANAKAGDIWVTMQVHVNIVAVALLKDLAGILLVRGRQPADDTLRKAAEEKVVILVGNLPAYETAGSLFAMMHSHV
jgi:hypothetical protein